MSETIPDGAKKWLVGGEFVTVATVLPSGQPQLTVMWVDYDGEDIVLSTVEGRQKHKNLVADPRITVLCSPREAPYSYLEVRGTASLTREGGRELIEKLSQRYTGGPYTHDGPDDVRVVIRVNADKVVFQG